MLLLNKTQPQPTGLYPRQDSAPFWVTKLLLHFGIPQRWKLGSPDYCCYFQEAWLSCSLQCGCSAANVNCWRRRVDFFHFVTQRDRYPDTSQIPTHLKVTPQTRGWDFPDDPASQQRVSAHLPLQWGAYWHSKSLWTQCFEGLLPGICVPVCSALLSTVSWVDSEELEPTLYPAGTIHGREARAGKYLHCPWDLPFPSGKNFGLPCRAQTCVPSKFFLILHTCKGKSSSAAKITGKMGALGSGSSLFI